MRDPFALLVSAATRAPSGDNLQPWRFDVDAAAGRIVLHLDPARDPSPMNAGQRMSRVALGAALENVMRTARHNGWDIALESLQPPTVVVQAADVRAGAIDPLVVQRVTNRRPYDGRALPPELQARLREETPLLDGVRTLWLSGRERLPALAALLGRADATMFGKRSMRRAFLGNVRFDAPARAEVAEGLSLASLELGFSGRLALRILRRLPHWLVRCSGALRPLAAHSQKLVESASGLCVLTAPDGREATDVVVGRALQRAWLALTAAGLAAQPMMSLLVLANLLERGCPEHVAAIGRRQVENLLPDFHQLIPEIGNDRPAFLLRIGFAPSPSGRTGRLDWQAVTAC